MDSLIIVPGENERFDLDKVSRDLQEIVGASAVKKDALVAASLECDYEYEGSSTILYLSDDARRISMRPLNDASMRLALELQKRDERPLLAFNQGYDFDLTLDEVATLADFKERMHAAYRAEVTAA